MGFSNKIKTILEMDDKDWKKALKSISEAEKQYFNESSANTEKLIQSKKNLANFEKERDKELESINKRLAQAQAAKTKALEKDDKERVTAINRIIKLYKQQAVEVKANAKVNIDAANEQVRNTKQAIDSQIQFNKVLKQAKVGFEEYGAIVKKASEEERRAISMYNSAIDAKLAKQAEDRKQIQANKIAEINAKHEIIAALKKQQRESEIATLKEIDLKHEVIAALKLQKLEASKAAMAEINSKYEIINALKKQKVQEEKLRADTIYALKSQKREQEEYNLALRDEYNALYKNTKEQNAYNNAKKKLDNMLQNGAITRTQYNAALEKEKLNLNNSQKATSKLTNTVVRHLRQIETLVIAYYTLSRGFTFTIGKGIEVNRMIEDNTNGIAALLSANTQMVLSNGQVVNSYEKFKIGQQVAAKNMEALKKASVDTYATFPQLTGIFQQAIGQTLSMGDAFGTTVDEISKNTIKLAQRMSNIGGAIGQPMDRIQEEIRSLLSGNASTDSLIATMIFGSPSEANEAIRKAKKRGTNGLKDMLDSYLGTYDVLEGVDTYSRAVLNLENAWDSAMKSIVKKSGAFEDIKNTFNDMAREIEANRDLITEGFDKTYKTIKNDLVPIIKDFGTIAVSVAGIVIGVISEIGKAYEYLFKNSISENLRIMASDVKIGFLTIIDSMNYTFVWAFNNLKNLTLEARRAWNETILGFQISAKNVLPESVSSLLGYDKNSIEETKRKLLNIKSEIAKNDLKIAQEYLNISTNADKNYKSMVDSRKQILGITTQEIEKTKELNDKQKKALENIEKANSYANLVQKIPIDKEFAQKMQEANEKAKGPIAGITKLIKKANDELEKYKKQYATASTPELKNIINEKIKTAQTFIVNKEKDILELKTKSNKKDIDTAEALEAKAKRLNKQYADQASTKAKLAMYETGSVDEAELNISLQQIKIASLGTELSLLEDKETREKVLIEIYEESFKLNEMISNEEEKQEKAKKKLWKEENKRAEERRKELIALAEEQKTVWDDVSKTMMQSMDDNFFNLITGKFDSLSDFAKSVFRDIFSGTTNNLARSLSSILSAGTGNILGLTGSTVASIAKAEGLELINGNWVGGGTSETGDYNISISEAGDIVSGAEKLSSDTLSTLSNLRSAYNFISNPMATIYAPSAYVGQAAGTMYSAGYTGVGNFLAGSANWLGGGTASGLTGGALAGSLTTGALVGGAGGYILGSLGDSLFGAETKASSYGAIGGAIGGMTGNPLGALIGAALGSVVGGMFGSTKQTDTGLFSEDIIGIDTLDAIERYTSYKKKSWFRSKSWTTYQEIDEKTFKAMETTFETMNTMADVLLGVTTSNITLEAGKYSKNTLIEKALPIALIDEVMLGSIDGIYDIWADYAEEASTTVIDAMQSTVSSYRETIREMSLFALRGDSVEQLKLQAEYAKADYELLAKGLGLDASKITVDNFNYHYSKAIKEDFTPEVIALWNNLGDALINATQQSESYTEALKSQTEAQAQALSDFTQSSLESITALKSVNFESFLNNINAVFETFITLEEQTESTIKALRSKQSTNTTFDQLVSYNQLIAEYESIKGTTDTKRLEEVYTEILSLSTSLGENDNYINNLVNYLEKQDFDSEKEIARVAIVDGLGELLELNQNQVDSLKEVANDGKITTEELSSISGLNSEQIAAILEVVNSTATLSTEGILSSLEEYAKYQLEAMMASNKMETEALSPQTFKYGDYTGAQEKIDISKALGVTYEEAEPFIEKIKALDVSQNLKQDISSMVLNPDTGYLDMEQAEKFTSIANYLSGDIKSTYGDIAAEAYAKQDFDQRYPEAVSLFEKEKAESDNAFDSYYRWFRSVLDYTHSNYYEKEEDISKGHYWTHSGTLNYYGSVEPWVFSSPLGLEYISQFKEARSAYLNLQALEEEKLARGFKNGGYTGAGNPNEIAGVAHKNEYYVKSPVLNRLGGPMEVENLINEGLRKKDLERAGMTTSMSYTSTANNESYNISNIILSKIEKSMVRLVQKMERNNQLSGASVSVQQEIRREVSM
jgi:hypothetical protein